MLTDPTSWPQELSATIRSGTRKAVRRKSNSVEFESKLITQKRYARFAASERAVLFPQSRDASLDAFDPVRGACEDVVNSRVRWKRGAVLYGLSGSRGSAWINKLDSVVEYLHAR